MTRKLCVCIGGLDEENCGWFELESEAPDCATYFLTCPNCQGCITEGEIKSGERKGEARDRLMDQTVIRTH